VHLCRRELQTPGINVHLGSARANLTYQRHLDELRRKAEFVDSEGMMLLLHFDPQSDRADPADVERFIATVLQPHPTLTVVIAHMGGSGSYGPWTRAIMRTFQDWLDSEVEAGRPRTGVYFDISAVWLARDSEGLPRTSRQEIDAIAEDVARYGVSRLVFGSDYPTFDPRAYAAGFRRTIGIAPEAWDTLLQNRVPGFQVEAAR
jgi:predicted TIM-barrel fold metal-dependent hydrolase